MSHVLNIFMSIYAISSKVDRKSVLVKEQALSTRIKVQACMCYSSYLENDIFWSNVQQFAWNIIYCTIKWAFGIVKSAFEMSRTDNEDPIPKYLSNLILLTQEIARPSQVDMHS